MSEQDGSSPVPPIVSVQPPADLSSSAEPEPKPLDRIPTPPFVIALALITALVFVVSLVKAPSSTSDGIKYERAVRALASDHDAEAVPLLKPLVAKYPAADNVKIDLISAYINSGNPEAAVDLLNSFAGKELDKDSIAKLNAISAKMRSLGYETTDDQSAGQGQ